MGNHKKEKRVNKVQGVSPCTLFMEKSKKRKGKRIIKLNKKQKNKLRGVVYVSGCITILQL